MKNYIDTKVYVKTDDKLIYVVESVDSYNNGCDYMQINLALYAGWDYINPDANNIQGWCGANHFVDDVQSDYIYQYFVNESMIEALEANGYEIIENIHDYEPAN